MPPAEAGEAAVVTVGRNPLAARFDRQRGQECIGNEVAARLSLLAKGGENLSVPFAGRDQDSVGLISKEFAKLQSTRERRRRMKDLRVRDDPQKSAQNQVADAERLRTGDDRLHPIAKAAMISGVFPVGVDENVDVGQNHDRPPSTRARPRCRQD
jgi:hypothetical protein